jgi:hypothetical protein
LLKLNLLGTSPSSRVAIFLKAPSDKSIELEFLHVGQASAIVTVTVWAAKKKIVRLAGGDIKNVSNLLVIGVSDLDLLSAQAGLFAEVSVPITV